MSKLDETQKILKLLNDIKEEIQSSKVVNILRIIKDDTKNSDPNFCKNKPLLYKIYSVIISSKSYIILSGNGGFGKTTTINTLLKNEGLSEYGVKFNEIVNCRNFYDWTRIKNTLNSDDSNFYVIDNFRDLTKDDFDFIINKLDVHKKHKNRIMFICRENFIAYKDKDNFSIIDCNDYLYKKSDLKAFFKNSLINEMKIVNNGNVNKMCRFIRKMPDFTKNPFFIKLMSNALIYHENQGDINSVFDKLKELMKSKYTTEDFPFLLIETLTGLHLMNNNDVLDELICLNLILNDTTFSVGDLKKILSTTIISETTEEFCRCFEIFTKMNEKYYIHSIYSDFLSRTFANYDNKRKCEFFSGFRFKKIIKNIGKLLEMGKADPFIKKVKYLSYAHNIWHFCGEYLNVEYCEDIFKGIDLDAKKYFIEFLNSYTFMLVKTYNNREELLEAETVQKQVILLIKTIKPNDYDPVCEDKYYSSLSRYYNVFAKVNLALALYSQSSNNIEYNSYFEIAEENLNEFEKCLDRISNDSRRICRAEVLDYTRALMYYKKSLYEIGINRSNLIERALKFVTQSEEKSLITLKRFEISEKIINISDVCNCLRDYDKINYFNLRKILSLSGDKSCQKLRDDINAHIATLELKCIIMFLLLYYCQKSEISIESKVDLCNETKKIIDFTYRALDDDIMRQREILLLKIEFERIVNCSSENLELVFRDKFKSTDTDDNRFKLLKNIIAFLSGRFDYLNEKEINDCCLYYGIDKDLFNQTAIGHKESLEIILYKYLTM